MIYEIILIKKIFYFFSLKKVIKVKGHGYPNDFNNNMFMIVKHIDGKRELINISKYESIILPKVNELNDSSKKFKLNKEQEEVLKKI